ncbi:hypothetical protein [Rhodomicrobium vannielii]|nr:hypothetical protein [Rhodomicrobium vannielii]
MVRFQMERVEELCAAIDSRLKQFGVSFVGALWELRAARLVRAQE